MKKYFVDKLNQTKLDYVIHSGDDCSPYIISISFIGCRAETLLNMLDDDGVMIGNGSACSSKNSGNRRLENMGVPKNEVESNVRISFNKYHTFEDVDALIDALISNINDYLYKIK